MNEGNDPDIYSVLYMAISDPRLIGDLLRHPEFRRRASQICVEIAGPADGEDLLQATCLQVVKRTNQLTTDRIRGEGDFFKWFTRLAQHVHLSQVLSAAARDRCIDELEHWPDASAAVRPEDMARFLKHADACSYHARLVRAEDEALQAVFRRARGLDSQGRILVGDERQARIAEHKRCLQDWRMSTLVNGKPFRHVALYNGDREIASCGEFYDFTIHKSVNELNPTAGLQICGVSKKEGENALLGAYALAGMRHRGIEQTLNLDNGYTVGLKVWEQGGTTYKIQFRCVETTKLKASLYDDDLDPTDVEPLSNKAPDVKTAPPVLSDPVAQGSAPWWPLLRSQHATAVYSAAVMVVMIVGWAGALFVGKVWGQAEALVIGPPAMSRNEVPALGKSPESSSTTGNKPPKPLAPPTPQSTAPISRKQAVRQQPQQAANRKPRRGSGTPTPGTRSTTEQAQQRQVGPPQGGGVQSQPGDLEKLGHVAIVLNGPDQGVPQIRGLNQVTTIQFVSFGGRASGSALHTTTDAFLGKRLNGALLKERLSVMPAEGQDLASVPFKVRWVASTGSNVGAKVYAVSLKAYISSEGSEKNFLELPSYVGVGPNWKAAYDAALKMAVKPVVAQLKEASLNASTAEPGKAERLMPEPWALPTHENEDAAIAAALLDRSEPNKPEHEKIECTAYTQ